MGKSRNLRQFLSRIPRKVWVSGGILLLVFAIALGTSNVWLAAEIERRIDQKLGEKGWRLERSRSSWSPWRGLEFENPRLRRGGEPPVAEAKSMAAGITLSRLLRGEAMGSGLELGAEPLILRDAEGEIRLDQVSIKLTASKEKIEIREAKAKADGLVVDTKGEIRFGSGEGDGGDYQPSFNAVRGVLAALPVREGNFKVGGTFTVDMSGPSIRWTANLDANGKDFVWHRLPLRQASAHAVLNEGDSVITADLVLPEGKSSFTIRKPGWQKPGCSFDGKLTDAAGRGDSFAGRYLGEGEWIVDKAEGEADLWSMARQTPEIATHLPQMISVETFPRIELRDLQSNRGALKLGSIALKGGGKASATVDDRRFTLTELSGSASFDGKSWHLKNAVGRIFGGEIKTSGSYRDGILDGATVSIAGIRLSELKGWSGSKSAGKGVLSGTYLGRLGADRSKLAGEGELRLVNAPVFDIPLLAETSELFRAMIPGADTKSKTGEVNARFTARKDRVDITRFEATGGSLEVSARGHVDLAKRRVDGVARGKLSGLPGVVTQPLSRLLEMEVSGPYDDIRVKPIGPARLVSNAASGTVGTAVDTVTEAGRVTGTVLKEGVKLPFRWLEKEDD